MSRIHLVVIATCLLSVGAASADFYKWTDEQGHVHFGDREQSQNSQKIESNPSSPKQDTNSSDAGIIASLPGAWRSMSANSTTEVEFDSKGFLKGSSKRAGEGELIFKGNWSVNEGYLSLSLWNIQHLANGQRNAVSQRNTGGVITQFTAKRFVVVDDSGKSETWIKTR